MLVIGIDPGVSGAIAFVDALGVRVHDAPTHQPGKRQRLSHTGALNILRGEIVRYVQQFNGDVRAVLEYAGARPGEGAAASFGFGLGYGVYLTALAALGVKLHVVTAKKWKGALGLKRKEGQSERDFKRESLQMATALFPDMATQLMRFQDNGRAEALLLAHYGRKAVWS